MKNIMIKTLLFTCIFMMLAWTSAQSKRPAYVPADAVFFTGKYYKFFSAKYSWNEAEKKCREMKGLLVSIKDKKTHKFLMKLSKGRCFWAGGSDAVTEGEWLWRDGTKITYSDWADKEPDDWKGKEDCLVLGWPGPRYENGKWADTSSIYHKQIDGYICEWK
jgi:hypothetical protein